jgi:hypothetical protein
MRGAETGVGFTAAQHAPRTSRERRADASSVGASPGSVRTNESSKARSVSWVRSVGGIPTRCPPRVPRRAGRLNEEFALQVQADGQAGVLPVQVQALGPLGEIARLALAQEQRRGHLELHRGERAAELPDLGQPAP